MCRHLGYLGRPRSLADLALEGPHSLEHQSYAPRLQQFGTMNVDGFGVGWHVQARQEPVRYRRAQPIWTDASFASLAPTISVTSCVAAVRAASPGLGHDESCAAPFTFGPWLFSHNGTLHDLDAVRRDVWPQAVGVPDAAAPVDSALLFALVVRACQSGAGLADALEQTIARVAELGGGRMNLLLSDGHQLAGTTYGDTLFVRVDAGSVTLASEPTDDDPLWQQVPEHHVIWTDQGRTELRPLAAPPCSPDPNALIGAR